MQKKLLYILLISVLVILFAVNYSFLDNALKRFLSEHEDVNVVRIIDGDTIEIENKESVRLLGINCPEKGEKYFEEAKDFLEMMILNKSVKLEFVGERYDKYNRKLAYVFLENSNINIEIVEQGFANYYFYSGKDKYSKDLMDAWENCIDKNINLCEASQDICAKCISINSDSIINTCKFECDISNWEIKTEGREKFVFPNEILESEERADFELDLSNSGGGLFLRDEKAKLVLWKS